VFIIHNLQNLKIIKEVQQGLNSIFELKCNMCQMHFKISSNEVQSENMESMEINTSCVEGIMSIGCEFYNLQELFSAMDIPSMTQRTYDKYNNIVSDGWERTATIAMQESAKKEAAFAIANGQADDNFIPCIVTKSWPVTAPGSQGVFRGRGRGFGFLKNGRQAAIVLSWLLLVQLPGQVLRSYSSKVSKSKRFLIVKQILVYSVTAKLSTEQYLVVRYWFTRMR
jgi:hypothetical protein